MDVKFTVKKNGKVIPGIELALTATSDKPSVTFSPTTITTGSAGYAITTISIGRDVTELSIQAEVGLQHIVWIRYLQSSGDYDITLNVADSEDRLPGPEYPLGSKHKIIVTATQDDKSIQGAKFTLEALGVDVDYGGKESMPTATFDPAAVITDANGQAETYLTLGDVPGYIDIKVNPPPTPRAKVARFYITNPGFTSKGSIEMDITLDDKSGKLSSTSDFEYPLSSVETPTSKKLVVKVKNTVFPGERVPPMDIVVSIFPEEAATITLDKFRTGIDGQAITHITFEADPQKDVHVHLLVNMVYIKVNLIEDNNVIPIQYGLTSETDRGINKIDDLEFRVGPVEPTKVSFPLHPAETGVLPLDTGAHFQFYPVFIDGTIHMIRPGALFTISTRQTADIQFIRSYATSNKDGLLMVRMYTGSEPGLAEINLTPLKQAQVEGSIRILAEDNDRPLANAHFTKDQDITAFNISSQNEFKLRQIATFKREDTAAGIAYDGMRVEVYVATRGIRSTGVEIGVYVKLYEGRSANTNDFDDVKSSVFVLPWNIPWSRGLIGWSYTDDPTKFDNRFPGLTGVHVPPGIKLPPIIRLANVGGPRNLNEAEAYEVELLGISHLYNQITPDIDGGR